MKIALLGYGKMGKMIAQMATQKGHEIVLKHDGSKTLKAFNGAQVAIDFSTPDSAVANIKTAFNHGVPVICGTTGWLDQMDAVTAYCKEKESAFIYASNFSLGVNLFFNLNKQLAALMEGHAYGASITEIHHTQKLDAPSGTAITLAQDILPHQPVKAWELKEKEATSVTNTLPITSKRERDIPGSHFVAYQSKIDRIEIAHIAHNRKGFALGAIVAAQWIINKQGVFTMSDVLKVKP